MGKASSKSLSLEQVRLRCDSEVWERWKKGFQELAGDGRLEAELFTENVIGDIVPRELSMRVFEVLDVSRKGFLSESDFLRGMGVFCKGSRVEILRFMFDLYDLDEDNVLSKSELGQFDKLIGDALIKRHPELLSWNHLVAECFGVNRTLSFKKFVQAISNSQMDVIVDWISYLFAPSPLEPSKRISPKHPPKQFWHSRRGTMCGFTLFSEAEVVHIERRFHRIALDTPILSSTDFTRLFSDRFALSEQLTVFAFNAFDVNKDGLVDVGDFVQGLSVCTRGLVGDLAHFVVQAFALEGEAKLSKKEFDMMWSLLGTVNGSFDWDGDITAEVLTECIEKGYVDTNVLFKGIQWFVYTDLCIVPQSKSVQREIIQQLLEQNVMVEGHRYFLIDKSWWDAWIQFTNNQGDHPGPIDNSILLSPSSKSELIPNLSENVHFKVLHRKVWETIKGWYSASPSIIRTAIASSDAEDSAIVVEIYPLQFTCVFRNPHLKFTKLISRRATLRYLLDLVSVDSCIEKDMLQIWDISDKNTPTCLKDLDLSVEDAGLIDGQCLYFDVKQITGTWLGYNNCLSHLSEMPGLEVDTTVECKDVSPTSMYNSEGLVGLYNLGNTCFMNSALQSLSLTDPLTKYFLSDLYIKEINPSNPLGMDGRVPLQYGRLLKQLWSAKKFDAVAPRSMKWTIGKFAPRFVGFQQHDSQELLLFVLDGLHEGLNRVIEKTYIEIPDSNDRSDEIVAEEHWKCFLQRNQSIIVDLFMGQLKSTLQFSCGKISVKFDPYQILSIPLPAPSDRALQVTVVFHEPMRTPMTYSISMASLTTVLAFKERIASLCGIPHSRLYLVEIYRSVVYGEIRSHQSPNSIRSSDTLFAYELPMHPQAKDVTFPKFNIEKGQCYDVLDLTKRWKIAKAIEVNEKDVKLRLGQGSHTLDEWIPVTSDRIQPFKSMSQSVTMSPKGHQFDGLSIPKSFICISVCHRLLKLYDVFIPNHSKISMLSHPILLFLNPTTLTGEKLYQIVWKKVHRYAPNPEGDTADTAYPPFILKKVGKNGLQCSECTWIDRCLGHSIDISSDLLSLSHGQVLALDWNAEFFEYFVDRSEMSKILCHSSIKEHKNAMTQSINFADCMKAFSALEDLREESSPYCSDCKEMHQATKSLQLWNTPPVLILHLKRLVAGRKIKSFVDFPLKDFDPSAFLCHSDIRQIDKAKEYLHTYDLFGVVNHIGGTNSGHYVTYGLHRSTDQWYSYDDNLISPMKAANVVTESAYMLFYIRKDVVFPEILNETTKRTLSRSFTEEELLLLNMKDDADGPIEICPWVSRKCVIS